ncbi:HNH endonuclease, partial [Nostoc sp.]
SIFYALRNNLDNFSKELFLSQVQDFHTKYSVENRRAKLSEGEKVEMLKEQGNCCAISGAILFIGDDIEVDHNVPLSIGGTDSKENFQIVHKDSNRSKGAKRSSE